MESASGKAIILMVSFAAQNNEELIVICEKT